MIELFNQRLDRDEVKRTVSAALTHLCYSTLKDKLTQILYGIERQEHEELVAHPNYRPPIISD